MLERWHSSNVWMLPINVMVYILFYVGIGLHFLSTTRSDLFTAARYKNSNNFSTLTQNIIVRRIILAIDLELWYIFSLRFVSSVKVLGPKLLMIRNMVSSNT